MKPVAASLVLVTALIAGPLAAQSPDVVPRSVFLPAEPMPVAEVECLPTYCHQTPPDDTFPGPFWTHTTNISPQTVWVQTFSRKSNGELFRAHDVLKPGGTVWVSGSLRPGEWVWIDQWVTLLSDPDSDPDQPKFQPVLLSFNASSLTGHSGVRANDTVASIQIAGPMPGVPYSSSLQSASGAGTPSWTVDSSPEGRGGQRSSVARWQANDDPRLNREVRDTVEPRADGYLLTHSEDEGRDGTVDSTTRLRFQKFTNGKRIVLTTFEGEQLVYRQTTVKSHNGPQELLRTRTDSDGDGRIDSTAFNSLRTEGTETWSETQRDFDADGVVDEIERMHLSFYGDRHSFQQTEIRDGAGRLKEKLQFRLTPRADGYRIVSFHDTDGDGSFDSREVQTSQVGAFANGYDVDRMQIDQDNDGVFDSSHTSVTRKVLGANSYREVISSDYGSDGSAEAHARREIRFRP